jgi:hypothetical protein
LGTERLVALAAHALERLLAQRRDLELPGRSALALTLPERFAGEGAGRLTAEGQTLLAALRAQLPAFLQDCPTETFPYGRAGGVLALKRAAEWVATGRTVFCGGVDSQHDWPALEQLAQSKRLLTASNVDGVRPGEGAAFVVLVPVSAGAAAPISVMALGLGREPNSVGSQAESHARGFGQALREAVAPLRNTRRRINYWLLDNSHEDYATQELQNIIARFGDVLGLETDLQMPLKELGDVGAAAVPTFLALGAESWRRGYAADSLALALAASDSGARGAVLFGLAEQEIES